MDFTNRNAQQSQPNFPGQRDPGNAALNNKQHKDANSKAKDSGWLAGKWTRAALTLLLLCGVALIVVIIILLAIGPNDDKEAQYVDTSSYQAVFLTNGQVYFGHLDKITPQYMDLTNIYYLQTSKSSDASNAPSNVTLVKLGCELHAPKDQMLIQTRQVSFWENLKNDGQVAQAIGKLPKCTPPANQNNATAPKQGSNEPANNSGSSNTSANSNSSNSSSDSQDNSSNSNSSSTPSSSTP